MTDIPGHLEHHLGLIDAGWAVEGEDMSLRFQVVRFSADVAGGVAFSTLGLSRYHLRSPTGRSIHQELLMIVPRTLDDGSVPTILRQVGQEAIESGTALSRGEVTGPRGRIFEQSAMVALYVAPPVYLPDDFAVCQTANGPVIMTWLVPITHSEAHFVFANGWSRFEDHLVDCNPDLVDVFRESSLT